MLSDCTRSAGAQGSPTGTLAGTISDPSGGVLPGVTVTAKSAQTGLTQQTVSGGAGDWRIPGLPVGSYEVSFELEGFKKLVRSGITVEAATIRSVPVTLEVGGLTETVQVAGRRAAADATTAATSRSLTAAELQAVPTSTGSFTHLLSSEAGVSADLPPVLTNGTGNISPSVNGTRTTSTSLFFNGIDATNLTSNEGAMSDNIAPGARHAAGSEAADQHVRRLDRPVRRRQLPARHAQRHQRVPRLGACSTSSTRT